MALHITLPYPPSANHNVRRGGGHFYTVPEVREYRDRVRMILRGVTTQTEPVAVAIIAFPPNRRKKRDLDNLLKTLFDACVRAGLFADDSLIKRIAIEWTGAVPGGKIEMLVEEYQPLH